MDLGHNDGKISIQKRSAEQKIPLVERGQSQPEQGEMQGSAPGYLCLVYCTPIGAAKAVVILLLCRTAGYYCIVQFAAVQLPQLCNTGPGLKGDWITFYGEHSNFNVREL